MQPQRLSNIERIEKYARELEQNKELTASDAVQAIGMRNITERSVGLVFRGMPDVMEMVPVKRSGRSKWRRK